MFSTPSPHLSVYQLKCQSPSSYLFGPPAWPHFWYEHFCFRVKLVIRILSSSFQVTHKLQGTLDNISISLPQVQSTNHSVLANNLVHHSSKLPQCFILHFTFNNTTASVSGIFELSAMELDFLSPKVWTYSFTNLLRSCSLLLCKNFICLDTFSLPIVSRSSLGLVSDVLPTLVGYSER